MGCRFPGAPSLDAYWKVLTAADRVIRPIPSERWNHDRFYDPAGGVGRTSVAEGGFLEGIDLFDAGFFGISPREAAKMDPQQRILLEITWEALEHAGMAPASLQGSATGVFIGIGAVDYAKVPLSLDDYYGQIDAHSGTGNALSIAANRLSYIFDWHGPSLSVDTACSSSLVALHAAARHLQAGEATLAVAGGVNLILSPETMIAFSNARMLSPDGHCRPFDGRANGYVRGEGAGVVVMKRLTDAVADGDRILAVMRGSAVNQDGRTSGLTAPNSVSQSEVIHAALAAADLSAEEISYIEAHGTGTPLGDPIEWEGLRQVFSKGSTAERQSQEQPIEESCLLSSVKANIGHLETAAGIASVIKVVLMMQRGEYVPQAGFRELNPHITDTGGRLRISQANTVWAPRSGIRRAGVSSFGFGGTNAHLILEDAGSSAASPINDATSPTPSMRSMLSKATSNGNKGASSIPTQPSQSLRLLALSARSETALRAQAEQLAGFLRDHPETDLDALCHTVNSGRNHFSHRLALTGTTTQAFQQSLTVVADSREPVGFQHGFQSPKVAFLFTGQGGQYPGMARQLWLEQPRFRKTLQHCDKILHELLGESILEIMHDPSAPERISQTRFTQPALFALEYSLGTLWRSWGIEPCGMLGHSVGEYVAATLAGVMTLEDGLRLISRRASLMHRCPATGMMAAVFASGAQVEAMLAELGEPAVSIAAYNGPANTVISGANEPVQRCLDRLAEDGIGVKPLTVSHAFHSALMDGILDEFAEFADTIAMQPPQIPLVSNLTGERMDAAPDAAYWRDHLRGAVRFEAGMRTLAGLGPELMLEVGPSAPLTAMGQRCLEDQAIEWLPSLRRGQSDTKVLLGTLKRLYECGLEIRWDAQAGPTPPLKLELPTYPFERKRHWYQATGRVTSGLPWGSDSQSHPLLGVELVTAMADQIFESRLEPQRPEWLAEHRVQGSTVFPAAAYLEQALAVAEELFGAGQHRVTQLSIQQAMFLEAEQPRRVQCTVNDSQSEQRQIRFLSQPADATADDPWSLHAIATVVRDRDTVASEDPSTDERATDMAHDESHAMETPAAWSEEATVVEAEAFYERMRRQGLDYGTLFRVLHDVRSGDGQVRASVVISEDLRRQSKRYQIHPALLDGCLQAIAGLVSSLPGESAAERLYLPQAVGEFRLLGDPCNAQSIVVRRVQEEDQPTLESIECDVQLLDAKGRLLAELQRVRVQSLGAPAGQSEETGSKLYQIAWQPVEPDELSETAMVEPATESSKATPHEEKGAVPGEVWLLFSPAPAADLSLDIAERLRRQLQQQGARCIWITAGDRFTVEDSQTYRIDVQQPRDYERLLEAIFVDESPKCAGVIEIVPTQAAYAPDGLTLEGPMPAATPVASLLWKSPLFLLQQVTRTRFATSPPIWLCSHGAQPVESFTDCDPRQALLWGLGRTAALEYPGEVRLVDLDPAAPADRSAMAVAAELRTDKPEPQIAWRGATRYAARLRLVDDNQEMHVEGTPSLSTVVPTTPFRLQFDKPGSFDALRLVPYDLPTLAADQVRLEVRSAGLNFSDVLKAMGLYPGITDRHPPLGIECAGVVTHVGPEVTRFAVGDAVMGVAPYSFASHAVTAEYTLTPMPANLSFEEAATVPITFLTAHHALCSLARLQPEEKVLIHAGAGGVGLAAIQIAQSIGAEVYATAGSDVKREYLRGLGVQHVFNSRTTEFAAQIMDVTGGQGVDVVLNSLPGEAIHKSLKILGAYGRFLEIGKTDIYQDQMIGLAPFQDNLSYFAIDLDRMLRQRPREIERLFTEVMQALADETYRPLPHTTFAATEIPAAFRYMAQRKNIGKVIVAFDAKQDTQDQVQEGSETLPLVRADVSYLIAGGLGALGLRMAQWLVEAGARSIVLMSRRAPTEDRQARIDRLVGAAEICCVQADVADTVSLQKGLEQIPAGWPPIAGVIHAAGGLADGLLYDMDPAAFETALRPKVDGGWNLHRESSAWPLDFFLMFSSVASILGSPGQGNYAAANAFLDTLAAYRRGLGLPATVINWGPWADGGMATDGQRDGQLEERGMRLLQPAECVTITERLLRDQNCHQAAVLDIDWRSLVKQFSHGQPPLMEHFSDRWEGLVGSGEQPQLDQAFLQQMKFADGGRRQELLEDYLTAELARILGTSPDELDKDQPLSLVGVDSLMAMELRTNLESQLGVEIPMAFLMEGPTIVSLVSDLLPLLANQASEAEPAESKSRAATRSAGTVARNTAAVVPLNSCQIQPAIFCLHPVGGDLRCYQALGQQLSTRRGLLAIRPRRADDERGPHDHVETLATDYCQLIREAQPSGPYLLMGWSTGGVFAYEIAQQLLLQNQRVEVLLIDTPTGASLDHVDVHDDMRFLYDLVRFSEWFSNARLKIEYDELVSLGRDRAIARVLAETTAQGVLPVGTTAAALEERIEMARAHLQGVLRYQPRPLGQPVRLYRPQQSSVLTLATGRQLQDDLGWQAVLGRNLLIDRVEGDHFSMLTGNYAAKLADEIAQTVEDRLPHLR